jgi:hypothetical protein
MPGRAVWLATPPPIRQNRWVRLLTFRLDNTKECNQRLMADPLRVHQYPLRDGIRPTPEFAKKKLAQFAANVGVKCGHGCTYCSSGALLRCHAGFKQAGESPFKHGYCIIDPEIPQKVALDAARRRNRGMVQLCTTVDAWCPGAQQFNLGRRCLEAILDQPGWTVRILTKNAAVMRDFDLIQEHRDRVLVGLSLTGPVGREGLLRDTAESLREAGFKAEADAVSLIRKRSHWSAYVTRLIQTLQSSLRRHGVIDKLRFLLYPSHLLPMDRAAIESDDTGIVWL